MKVQLQGHTEVYVDSYEHGELEHVNAFSFDKVEFEVVDKDDIETALDKYFNNLGYDFNYTDDGWIEPNIYSYHVLVDADNCEADSKEIELWKQDKMKLYSSLITVSIDVVSEFKAY